MKEGAGGWTSPQVIVAAIGIVSMTGASYIATQADDSEKVQLQLNDHARRIAVLETRLEYIAAEAERERRRPDG